MRPGLVALLLVGCSLGPPPTTHPPPRTPGCVSPERAILGTWVRDRSAMEIRADGTILRDSVEGAFRWTGPGHATIDIAGTHEEHTLGLMGLLQLLDVDMDGRSYLWARVSSVTPHPASCFDVGTSLVGDWTDGTTTESFRSDGTYVRGDVRGHWVIAEQGYLDIASGMRARRYRLALAAPDLLISAFDGPLVDDDPRGPSLVEARLR